MGASFKRSPETQAGTFARQILRAGLARPAQAGDGPSGKVASALGCSSWRMSSRELSLRAQQAETRTQISVTDLQAVRQEEDR
jgi:hypothetical protein